MADLDVAGGGDAKPFWGNDDAQESFDDDGLANIAYETLDMDTTPMPKKASSIPSSAPPLALPAADDDPWSTPAAAPIKLAAKTGAAAAPKFDSSALPPRA
jgi:hypothetical protein